MKSIKQYLLESSKENLYFKDKYKSNFTDKEKNELAKKYVPLVHKIANQYKGYDNAELFNAGLYGLGFAIEHYDKEKIENGVKEITFFAKYIDISIKMYIEDESRLVRLPRTQTKGNKFHIKQNNLSLNNLLNKDSNYNNDELDTEENDDFKYRDKLKYIDSKYTEENIKFVNDTWDKIFKDIEDNFSKKSVDILKSYYGIGCKPVSGKELAKKYGYRSPASISEELKKIKKYLLKNFKYELRDLQELYNESLNEEKEAN